jgi:hypothetical protein
VKGRDGDACWPKDAAGAWKTKLTVKEANAVFDEVQNVVNVPEKTSKGRKRRTHQLVWTSHLKELKRLLKKTTPDKGDNEEESSSSSEILEQVVHKKWPRQKRRRLTGRGKKKKVSDKGKEEEESSMPSEIEVDSNVEILAQARPLPAKKRRIVAIDIAPDS